MKQTIKTRTGRVLVLPTPEEDAAINAGVAQDPDTYVLGAAEFKQLRRGRPLGSGSKVQVTLLIDQEVVEIFKAAGAGWQTRMNDALKNWTKSHQA
ncbi:MAG: BrnA antitoxin family protein [Gammaproteobacteria bacterium]|uniref:BrnA antitoxin family protein n=1 Tax=Rhodoferax sp. TaxID=50421 RepID=UPI0017EBDDC4|nr:BrnA antitoxin family protein [Rhodoferax sp.]MBU3897660.1 BrnA antitoxin family protein [Gammaproteobacteria bacterium]MBA3056299.1 BrnA antitoxin family protein [Rhodoferax sp.]MBU4080036.1 BrnA antitoxin family protein [Gammaproteobacteria bacterium]MBU4112089.1 BrnA antitoxin family protein [Gammaproteobacteria bacterium]MBU4172314.1 BrnA antitoxin family protein [Gammaproteobacteria bacterium]